MGNDITNRDISRAHVYHKLRYPNKGHMNEHNPTPSLPGLLAIGILIIQGQPSSEGIATHTQDQIFYDPSGCRAHAHHPRSGGAYVYITTTCHGYTCACRHWQNSPCHSASEGGVQRAGECVTAAPVYVSHVVRFGIPPSGFKERSAAPLVALISQAVALCRTRKGVREVRRIPCHKVRVRPLMAKWRAGAWRTTRPGEATPRMPY
jgi:hypothetical protein